MKTRRYRGLPGGSMWSRRLGLRARLTFAFALGALVLSALLVTVVYGLVRANLVHQREASATRQAFVNARQLRESLKTEGVDPGKLLDSLQTPAGASPVLFRDGQWYALTVERGRRALPAELRREVITGQPARMRYDLAGETQLAVGVPLPAVDAAYFEITSLAETERTLRLLALSLLGAAVLTTAAGALLGATASRGVLRPLRDISDAAVAIAGGRLDTRVAPTEDADLGPLISSFNEMARSLQERVERDARFASDVSHELRSPLTTLSASISIIESRRHELPERAAAALDLLVADVQRFSAMVEDLLEISRFDAGAAQLDLEDVRISELVLNSVAASTDDDVPVEIESGAADCIVQVDKRRIVRVIANLIGNADRHGGGATRVSVDLAEDDRVQLAVEDAGPGVDDDDRERVFERFARGIGTAGRRGSYEGVGLGLALVREHVGLHGGRVWVEDRHDGQDGARFVVELPTVAAPPVDEPPPEDLGPAAVPAAEVDNVPAEVEA